MSRVPDTAKLIELIKRSRLLADDELAKALDWVRAERGGELPADAGAVADQLVQGEYLSRWQADNLLAGRHKGFRLGSYRLLRHLGTGGMSMVYLAEHELMRRRAAIKVLPQNRVEDSSYLARFHREARASAALDHPNVVRIYDVSNQDNTHYIAMEYIDGHDLQTRVQQNGPLTYEEAADCIAQAARGLQHAHDANLIHRDIKPANLLVDRRGVVKVLDMGLAKFHEDDKPSLTLANDDNVLGTVDYLAPEQALNSHSVDARADIYSLGCTLYFLLTGHPPFPQGSMAERLMKHQKEAPSAVQLERPDSPAELVMICNRMMAKNRADRIQTAGEGADALTAWLASRGRAVTGDSAKGGDSGPLNKAVSMVRETATGGARGPSGVATTEPSPGADTVLRIQAGTRGTAPAAKSEISAELELEDVVDDKTATGKPSHPASAPTSPEATEADRGVIAAMLDQQATDLAKELKPLDDSADEALIRGGKVAVEKKLPPIKRQQMPLGAWIAIGLGGFVLFLLLIFVVMKSFGS